MRYVLAVLAVLVIAGALAGVKFKQISGLIHMGQEMQKAGPPPEKVASTRATDQTWEGTLDAVGSIAPARGVAISNEVPGVVSKIHFESGQTVRQGQVLIELDTSVERAQLASAIARKDLAGVTAGRTRALVESQTIAKSTLDTDEAQLKTTSTDAEAIQAQIDRKTVRAPFSGRLGIRQVNLGQYLNPGTPLTVLEAIDSVYVDFTLPQQRLGDVKVGMPVRIDLEGGDGGAPREGAIAAIDPQVDASSRSIKLRASIANKEEKLRPGMFARVSVVLPQHASVVTVPATALVHAPYGDSVFIVEDKKDDAGAPLEGKVARQQFVRAGESRGDFVALLDGVKAGQEVVTSGAFKLHNNTPIAVSADTKTAASTAPRPDNR